MIPPPVIGPLLARVRVATSVDLNLMVHLQRVESDALGFVPRLALAEKVERNQALVGLENDEPAAFILFGSTRSGSLTIYQTAALLDVRRRELGLDLATMARVVAGRRGCSEVRLCCADDLKGANAFWEAAGFDATDHLAPRGSRGRGLIVYKALSINPVQGMLLEMPHFVPRRLSMSSSDVNAAIVKTQRVWNIGRDTPVLMPGLGVWPT